VFAIRANNGHAGKGFAEICDGATNPLASGN